jgi:Cu(I)/Ag(I) efflux system membrane protein CusA/SilA
MLGGMITAPLLSMFVIPAAYKLMRRQRLRRQADAAEQQPAPPLRVAARR